MKWRAAFVFGVAMDFRGTPKFTNLPGEWTLSANDLHVLTIDSVDACRDAKESAEAWAALVAGLRTRRPKRSG